MREIPARKQVIVIRTASGLSDVDDMGASCRDRWTLTVMGLALIIFILVCLVPGEFGISLANSPAGRNIEMTSDRSDMHASDAQLRFDEHARATEAGFNAAFPFHKQ